LIEYKSAQKMMNSVSTYASSLFGQCQPATTFRFGLSKGAAVGTKLGGTLFEDRVIKG
jgi:hypothetical protein